MVDVIRTPVQRTFPYPSTSLLLLISNPQLNFHSRSIPRSRRRFLFLSWPLLDCSSRRWDSNTESYERRGLRFNRSDEVQDAEEEFDDKMEGLAKLLEDYIDSIWIFRVFRSFRWMLPPIILSFLLGTGLKAFRMALALPVGQSTMHLHSKE